MEKDTMVEHENKKNNNDPKSITCNLLHMYASLECALCSGRTFVFYHTIRQERRSRRKDAVDTFHIWNFAAGAVAEDIEVQVDDVSFCDRVRYTHTNTEMIQKPDLGKMREVFWIETVNEKNST